MSDITKPHDPLAGRIRGEEMREILEERTRQNQQWGGADHDDTHTPGDWCEYITKQLEPLEALVCAPASVTEANMVRRQLIKVAALALAALESGARIEKKRNDRMVGMYGLDRFSPGWNDPDHGG